MKIQFQNSISKFKVQFQISITSITKFIFKIQFNFKIQFQNSIHFKIQFQNSISKNSYLKFIFKIQFSISIQFQNSISKFNFKFNFKIQFQNSISKFNFKIQFQNSISKFNFKIQFQNSISKFNFKIQFQNSISKFNFKIQFQNSISKFNFKIQFQNSISKFNFKIQFQNSISKFDFKIQFQNSISKFNFKFQYQNSISKFNFKKGSARRPTGKEKSKPGKGSFGAPSLIAPHSTPYSPPGRSSTALLRSMPSSSAVDAKPSIADLVRTSLGIDRGGLSLSPSPNDRSKRGLNTPTMGRPLLKYRNPLDLLRSPNKGKTSLAKNSNQDVPASQNDGGEVGMTIKIVNKPKPDKSFVPF